MNVRATANAASDLNAVGLTCDAKSFWRTVLSGLAAIQEGKIAARRWSSATPAP